MFIKIKGGSWDNIVFCLWFCHRQFVTDVSRYYNYMCGARRRAGSAGTLLPVLVYVYA